MKRTTEKQIRLDILEDCLNMEPGSGMCYPHADPIVNEVARELINEGLVTGSVSRHTAVISGIRDAGLLELSNAKPVKKAYRLLRRLAFVAYSIILIAIGYVLNLDSVKEYFSNIFQPYLQ